MASVEQGSVSQIVNPGKDAVFEGRNFAFLKTAASISTLVSASPVYWLSALQDGTRVVSWVSFTPDLTSAPEGHNYTNLVIQATWFI